MGRTEHRSSSRSAPTSKIFSLLSVVVATMGSLCLQQASAREIPSFDHVVLVMMENHAYSAIMASPHAPYLNALAKKGAAFDQSFAVAHPSEPNYFALFSGSIQDVADDGRYHFNLPNIVTELRASGKDFAGFVETGSPRKHNPWESFADAANVERSFDRFAPNYAALPALSFVIPNLRHDMHDGSIDEADAWLRTNMSAYADWTLTHNSLLIITFDDDDGRSGNRIFTLMYGAHIEPNTYSERIDHFAILRTIEAPEGISALGFSRERTPITDVWGAEQP